MSAFVRLVLLMYHIRYHIRGSRARHTVVSYWAGLTEPCRSQLESQIAYCKRHNYTWNFTWTREKMPSTIKARVITYWGKVISLQRACSAAALCTFLTYRLLSSSKFYLLHFVAAFSSKLNISFELLTCLRIGSSPSIQLYLYPPFVPPPFALPVT